LPSRSRPPRALRAVDDRRHRERLAHEPPVLERHAVGRHERRVAHAVGERRARGVRARRAVAQHLRQPREARPAPRRDVVGRAVGAEERRLVVLDRGDEARQAQRQPRVPGERRVLGLRQQPARVEAVRRVQRPREVAEGARPAERRVVDARRVQVHRVHRVHRDRVRGRIGEQGRHDVRRFGTPRV
jgi:hypothetical protein